MASLVTAEACDSNVALLSSGDLRCLQPNIRSTSCILRSNCDPCVLCLVGGFGEGFRKGKYRHDLFTFHLPFLFPFPNPSTKHNIKVFEDNVLVRELLETRGEGRVLVIDGGGSKKCALLGGNLGQSAQNMGWAGIVINGCVRDVDEINGCDIGVRALASHPQKSNKKWVGEKHVTIHFAGTLIRDGEWLYADSDGILVSKTELSV